MKRLQVPPLTEEQPSELEELYRRTKTPRLRTRAQIVLLSAEKGYKAEEIAQIVRESHITVLRWLKRYLAEGLMDEPRPGRSAIVTEAYLDRLKAAQVQISMDGRGRALDNIFTERLWRSVKYEEVYLNEYEQPRHARQSLGRYLSFYNLERPHQALDYCTPAQVYFA